MRRILPAIMALIMLFVSVPQTGAESEKKVSEPVKSSAVISEGFEGDLDSWQFIDADGDGYGWQQLKSSNYAAEGNYFMASASYLNGIGPLTPDNWMVSPVFSCASDSEITWYDRGMDADYCQEKYEVHILPWDAQYVSDGVCLGKFTSGASWQYHSLDIGDYAGYDLMVAFRHCNTTDMFNLMIDAVEVTGSSGGGGGSSLEDIVVPDTIMMQPGEQRYFPVSPVPSDASLDGLYIWSGSEGVVYIDDYGVMYAMSCGTSTVTVGVYGVCEKYVEVMVTDDMNYLLYEDFEGDVPGWGIDDLDGDGDTWFIGDSNYGFYTFEGQRCASSSSYDESLGGVLYPDNWLISPVVSIRGDAVLSWYVSAQFAEYSEEYYSVYLIPGDSEYLTDDYCIYSGYSSPSYTNVTVDLSEFSGEDMYIAFRHWNCSDNFMINIDLVTVVTLSKTWTVTFVDGMDGSVIDVQHVVDGDSAKAPSAPKHTGFNFSGWDTDFSCVTCDLTVTAQYSAGGPAHTPGPGGPDGPSVPGGPGTSPKPTSSPTGSPTTTPTDDPTWPPFMMGDVNGDGRANTADAVVVLRYCAGLTELSGELFRAGDVTYDGIVNTADATKILYYIADIIDTL